MSEYQFKLLVQRLLNLLSEAELNLEDRGQWFNIDYRDTVTAIEEELAR